MKPWPRWRAAARCAVILVAPASLAACASYHPQPLAPLEIARHYHTRLLEQSAVSAELKRIAPDVAFTGESWDRLSLLAAAMQGSPAVAEARAHVATLGAGAQAAKAGPPIILTLTAEYAKSAPESSPWLYGVASDIPLDISEVRNSRISAAAFAAIAAQQDYVDAIWTVRMSIRRALAEALLSEREDAIGQSLDETRQRQLLALERRVTSGEAPRADLERVRAEAAADSRRMIDAQARQLAAQAVLADAIGVSPMEIKKLSLAWVNLDAPAGDGIDVSAYRDQSLSGRADVLRAMAEYDQSEAELRGEIAKQWPQLSIGPGYMWERGLVKLPFTIGLSLPSFDLNRASIDVAEAKRVEAGIRLEGIIARAQAATDAALLERGAAYSALARIRDVDLKTAARFAAQADQELSSGAIDRVDWTAARVGLRLAELAEIEALRRVHEADAALEDALRRPLEGPELQIAPKALGARQ